MRQPGRRAVIPRPRITDRAATTARIAPAFDRLRQVLDRDPGGLALRNDPTALAPERLLVFEVTGSIQNFVEAIRRVPGLEFEGEDDASGDEMDANPVTYLLVPDAAALRQILRLWELWQAGQPLGHGFSPWRSVFDCLRDVRPWGPQDRVSRDDANLLEEAIFGKDDNALQRLEIELVFRASGEAGRRKETELSQQIAASGGRVVSRARIAEIAYHAVLVDIPVAAVRRIVELDPTGLAGVDPILSIKAQSLPTPVLIEDGGGALRPTGGRPAGEPIAAILDAVPQSEHVLLRGRLSIDDPMDLAALATGRRSHGTGMASLVVHGDLNRPESALARPIEFCPIMFEPAEGRERFPDDRLIVDVFYTTMLRLKVGLNGEQPVAPSILIVNVSLGDAHRRFAGRPSAWARAIDRLATLYGLLFVVSAGNVPGYVELETFRTTVDFEAAPPEQRSEAIVRAVSARMAERRLFSPAESLNALTVGALHDDAVAPRPDAYFGSSADPFPTFLTANASSALGPGIGGATKPEILVAGGRERVRVLPAGDRLRATPEASSRFAGLRAAAPHAGGLGGADATVQIVGTSPAAALTTRTAHQIHDALEQAYPDFLTLSPAHRALLLKALVAHPARWPDDAASMIGRLLGPHGQGQAVRRKDNIRRFLGLGAVDCDEAIACSADRATLWAVGMLRREAAAIVDIPIPDCIAGRASPHEVRATLAWFSPVSPGRQAYRIVRLKLLDPPEQSLVDLGIKGHTDQPDANQARRGTLLHRRWSGTRAAALARGNVLELRVQREPDLGEPIDAEVLYAIAVTVQMPGEERVYEEIRARVAVQPRVRV